MTLNPLSSEKTARTARKLFQLSGLCAGALLFAGMLPDAPVMKFRLPMFSDEGTPLWDLRGQEGRYIDENRVDVFGMNLSIFAETDPTRIETRIHSPMATMHVQRNAAEGSEEITMEGDHYVIRGKQWFWDGNESRVSIDEDVQVLFHEDISDLFR